MTDQHGTPSGSTNPFPLAGGATTFDINRNMTDSQFRNTWNQISSAASATNAAASSAYASPAPQPAQNKAYLKNIHTWSSTSSPAPRNAGMSSSRPSRVRTTRANAGTSTPTPGTPVQPPGPTLAAGIPVSTATTYVQPIYSHPAVPAPMQAHHQPLVGYPQVQAAVYAPAVSNPPKAPLHTKPQALESTYSSRLKTGASLLVQPILTNNTSSLLGGVTRSSRRGMVINYADPASGDDLPDAGELDSGDSDFAASGGTRAAIRQQTGTRQTGGSMGVFNSTTGVGSTYASPAPQPMPPKSLELDQSYLGMVPPARFIKPRSIVPTPHEYPAPDVVLYQAQKRTSLVPIRVEFETDTLRIRDCFVWNMNEALIKPESFARIFCNDLDLPLNPWAETIAAQIKAQLEDFQDVAAVELGMDGAINPEEVPDSVEELPECRVILSIDVQIANHHLVDLIEWDLLSPLTPEEFSRKLCSELGLTGEAIPLVAHAVHEELVKHKKDVIEWGVLGSASVAGEQQPESTPAPTGADGATTAPEKRDRSGYSLLKDKTGLGLGWGRAPRDGRGPKTLRGVWRDWVDAEEFATTFEILSAEEVERREVERERASRRLRRETSKFQSNATGRMRNLRYR